jgi:hypothetical protein
MCHPVIGYPEVADALTAKGEETDAPEPGVLKVTVTPADATALVSNDRPNSENKNFPSWSFNMH